MEVFSATGSARESDRREEPLKTQDRKQADVDGQDGIVPPGPEPSGQAPVAHVLVAQESHPRAGPSSPRARSLAASRSRSCSMSGRFRAT